MVSHYGDLDAVGTISGSYGAFSNSLTISGVPVPIKTPSLFVPFTSYGWMSGGNAGAWPNMPSVLSFLNNDVTVTTLVDLTDYNAIRLHAVVGSGVGSPTAGISLRYKEQFSTGESEYDGLNVSIPLASGSSYQLTPYSPLPSQARGPVYLTVVGSGGDGAADVSLGGVKAELARINVFHYTSSQNNVNFFVDAGSPASGDWEIVIDDGVIIGSTSTSLPAAVTGVFPGKLLITVLGRIQGAGGNGGQGQVVSAGKLPGNGGGGGGGAGSTAGTGGNGQSAATSGANGTAEGGGAKGNPGGYVSGTDRGAQDGSAGGPALLLSMSATIASGQIWGGGGGGAGSQPFNQAGNGGGPGQAGGNANFDSSGQGGAAGKAVDLNGQAAHFVRRTDVRGVTS